MENDFFRPVMPKEHGLWVWVFLPVVVGGLSSVGDLSGFYLLLGMVFFGFMALTPARIFYKNRKKETATAQNILFWCGVYALFAVIFSAELVFKNGSFLPWVLLMAAGFYIGVCSFHGGFQRDAWFEFGGLAALSLGSLVGSYAVTGRVVPHDFGVWLLVLLFLVDRSMESRRVVRLGGFRLALAEQQPDIAARMKPVFLKNLVTSFFTLLFALAILEKFQIKYALFWPVFPGFAVTLYFYLRPPHTLRRLGLAELFLALFFAASFVLITRFY
jgi:hypothetical protein